MATSIRGIPKKRGRPKTTGRGEGVMVRLQAPQMAALDNWIAGQESEPTRPEAIRLLMVRALASAPVESQKAVRKKRGTEIAAPSK
jgi:hypothetical protein